MTDRYETIEKEIPAYAEARKYRRAFWITLLTTVALVIVAAALWWRLNQKAPIGAGQQMAAPARTENAAQPNMPGMAMSEAPATPAQSEVPLAPIQLTPQRMQSIGVQIGQVEYKAVSDELRFYGNVQANERRLAYVQTRFAGWIRQVYADATGDFVRKGQPLFTIYSPDLVTTEQEYLIAK